MGANRGPSPSVVAFPCVDVDFERMRERLGSGSATVFVPEGAPAFDTPARDVVRYRGTPRVAEWRDECWLWRDPLGLRSARLGVAAFRSGAPIIRVFGPDDRETRWSRARLSFEIARATVVAPLRGALYALRSLLSRAHWLDALAYRVLLRFHAGRPPDPSFQADTIHFFVGSLGLGGTQRQLVSFVRSLSTKGFRSKVWVVSRRGFFAVELEQAGARCDSVFDSSLYARCLHLLWKLFGHQAHTFPALALARQLARERPAVLQCLLDETNVAGALGGRIARVPVVVMGLRSLHPKEKGGPTPPFQRECYRLLTQASVEAVVANSAAGRDSFLKHAPGFEAARVRVVRNGLEPPRAAAVPPEEIRRSLALSPSAPVILWAGRLAPEKRLDLLLRALARLHATGRDFEALIVGQGREREASEDLARVLDLGRSTHFLDPRTDMPELLATARVVVLTSDLEGLPNILLEAQLAGRAVVSTRVGGVPELVVDGVTGWLVDAGDEVGFADRLTRLLDDPALADAMGKAGAERGRNHFSLARMADETLALYRELALRRGIRLDAPA